MESPIPPSGHARKLERVARQLRGQPRAEGIAFRKRAVSHQVPMRQRRLDRTRTRTIDVRDLDAILAIDPVGRQCTAEPGVTFERLVRATAPYGLCPLIVPELRTITVGGAVSGCALESTSFRHGGFHDTCTAYEVVTAKGDVLECTPDNEHALVFQMLHGTFGTLGLVSKLTFRLGPCLPYVHVVYDRHASLAAFQAAVRDHCQRSGWDFIDGFIHSPRHFVLALGRYVDRAPYTHAYDWTRVFCESTRNRTEDFLKVEDYFFRYDHGVTNVHPKSYAGRLLFGKFMSSARLLALASRLRRWLPAERPDVTVDTFLPMSSVEPFLGWYEKAFGFYPVWVVPYRRVRDYEWLSPRFWSGVADDLFLDLAVYGMPQPPGRNLYKELEAALDRVGGVKSLISHNFYDEQAFWRTWNEANYRAAKRVTDPAGVFGDLYAKTCRG
jgi:FAD/FMN-containing dehydrogenase